METPTSEKKWPRLWSEETLQQGGSITLQDEQIHYLKTVMRRPDGSMLRLFNGRDGEWSAKLIFDGKKSAHLEVEQQLKTQRPSGKIVHLIFTPLKKDRLDFLIEKAVELGVTHLHPVVTQQTVIRDINEQRLRAQIIEAAEQCERLDCPQLHPLEPLESLLQKWDGATALFAALERSDAKPLAVQNLQSPVALLIGPEGGFSEPEREMIMNNKKIIPVTLGDTILRAETAALTGLSIIKIL